MSEYSTLAALASPPVRASCRSSLRGRLKLTWAATSAIRPGRGALRGRSTSGRTRATSGLAAGRDAGGAGDARIQRSSCLESASWPARFRSAASRCLA
jgi:hypothetical protein